MPCDLTLVIHALTQWNVDRRTQGHTDTPLNAEGRDMALRLATRLRADPPHVIWSSDLRRAQETAAPVAELLELPVHLDPALREGRWPHQERNSEHPVLPFPVESETGEDVLRRMIATLTAIAEANDARHVLVVSHGGAVKAFVRHVRGAGSDGADGLPPHVGIRTALNRFRWDGRRWSCLTVDDAAHLGDQDPDRARKDAG